MRTPMSEDSIHQEEVVEHKIEACPACISRRSRQSLSACATRPFKLNLFETEWRISDLSTNNHSHHDADRRGRQEGAHLWASALLKNACTRLRVFMVDAAVEVVYLQVHRVSVLCVVSTRAYGWAFSVSARGNKQQSLAVVER